MRAQRHHVLSRVFARPNLPRERLLRREFLAAALRASVAGFSMLTSFGLGSSGVVASACIYFVLSLCVWPLLRRASTVRDLHRVSGAILGMDLTVFFVHSWVFHSVVGAGSSAGIVALLVGCSRGGVLAPAVALTGVALTAIVFPQASDRGFSAWVSVLLCLGIGVVAVMIRMLADRDAVVDEAARDASSQPWTGTGLVSAQGTLTMIGPGLAELLGSSDDELRGRRLTDLLRHRDDLAAVPRAIAAVADGSAASTRRECEIGLPGERSRWVILTISPAREREHSCAAIYVQDIDDRKRAEQALRYAAAHDALTGLPNRTQLMAQLEQITVEAPPDWAIMFLDLDRFKSVNDSMGHAAGDALLCGVAARVQAAVRPQDIVARLGGDEFVVVAIGAGGVGGAVALAHRIATTLDVQIELPCGNGSMQTVFTACSIGVATSRHGATGEDLLQDADMAMYEAKRSGLKVATFSPSMRDRARRHHELEQGLRSAISQDQLHVVYQPLADLQTGVVVGAEALLRWEHPLLGIVSPAEFIPVAEETGLICGLGSWVLRQAVAEASTWARQGDGIRPHIAVNVSMAQLVDGAFPAEIAALLAEFDLPAGDLCLEVTETALPADVWPVVACLQQLRALGVRLAIDDFGTGHASLTYLARLPVDVVKIDRTFVEGLSDDASTAVIIAAVVSIARTFGLEVVAEGIETAEQHQALLGVGVRIGQGYLLGKPAREFFPARISLPTGRDAHAEQTNIANLVPRPRAALPSADTRFETMLALAADLSRPADLETVFRRSFTSIHSLVECTGGSIQLVEDGALRIAYAEPEPTAAALAARLPLGTGVGGKIAVTGRPAYVASIPDHPSVTPGRSQGVSAHARSYYGVPLIVRGEVLGVLQLDAMTPDAWSPETRALVLSLAPTIALAVADALEQSRRPLAIR